MKKPTKLAEPVLNLWAYLSIIAWVVGIVGLEEGSRSVVQLLIISFLWIVAMVLSAIAGNQYKSY